MGESLHSLRRDLFFAHEGAVRRRHLDQQTDQALCLSLVVNAIITWNTTPDSSRWFTIADGNKTTREVEREGDSSSRCTGPHRPIA
jgi:hypothetical protein